VAGAQPEPMVVRGPMSRSSVSLERRLRRWGGGPGLLGYLVVAGVIGVALLLYFLDAHTNAANGGAVHKRGTGFVLGETTGIAAAVLLAFIVILASRLAVMEVLFGDLTKVYVAHGVLGMSMFALVSFHPLMYLVGGLLFGASFLSAAHVLVPFHVVLLDWISYITIAAALIPTMYMRLSFVWWRAIHLLLGAALILTGYSILIDNAAFDTSQIPALRDYLYVLFILGAASFLWVAVFRRIAEPKREYRILEAEYHEAANAIELSVEPVGRPVRFRAGQFAYVDILQNLDQVRREFEAHPFSIASAPGEERLKLVIEGAGDHTRRVQQVSAGDDSRVLIHGSFGRLVIDRPERRKQLWLAGGIGITPFLAMADELSRHPDAYADYDVILVVGVDTAEQAFHLERLRRYERAFPGLSVHVWDRSERGLPTAEAIRDTLAADITDRAVMISGPEVMLSHLTRQLLALGVHRGQIRSERAIGPPGRWELASPALRYTRYAATAFFSIFILAVVVSTVSRAVAG
jgi:predicted ferric reductase